jgi:phenylalanyl-tRNA synthetase beta chain
VVDVTNFVMLEFGQPLHAFDRDRLSEGIINVRFAREGEQLQTLDGQVRTLQPSMLVIADGDQAIALAGVMGGSSSEVTAQTTRILLESAKFAGSIVRKTSRQLALRSESSLRFEKEVNIDGVTAALDRAASLLAELAGGTIVEGIVSASTVSSADVSVDISLDKINQYLGTSLQTNDVQAIFERLCFQSEWLADEHIFRVSIPKRRGDISRDVDLIEEVARLFGYDNIPTSLVFGDTTVGALSPTQSIRRNVRRTLIGIGIDEVINYSFTHPQKAEIVPGVYGGKPAVRLSLPMSEERSVLRQSLIPHLLDVATHNRNHNQSDVAVFEIGHVFVSDETTLNQLPEQPLHLGFLLTGLAQPGQWLQSARAVDFYDLKGVLDRLLASLGIFHAQYQLHSAEGYHPGRTAQITVERAGEQIILGVAGQLHPNVQQMQDLSDTYVAELDFDVLTALVDTQIGYRSLPKYPESKRDLALVVGREVPSIAMVDIIRQAGGELLQSVQVFDVYTGDKIDITKKSVAFALQFRHDDRTLQDEEVQALIDRILQMLAATFAAELRK